MRRRSGSGMPTGQRPCLLAGLFRGHAEMDLEGFGELAADRQDGIEEVIGSWKIMAISRPRMWRIDSSSRARRFLP